MVGGLTPSYGFMRLAAAVSQAYDNLPIVVMIRPRAGDFVYTPEETMLMKYDIEMAR